MVLVANGSMRGHNFVWGHSNPLWLLDGGLGPQQLRSVLRNHIATVGSRYADKFFCWDVVNEAVSGDVHSVVAVVDVYGEEGAAAVCKVDGVAMVLPWRKGVERGCDRRGCCDRVIVCLIPAHTTHSRSSVDVERVNQQRRMGSVCVCVCVCV